MERNVELFLRFSGFSNADLEQMLRESMDRYIKDPRMAFDRQQAEKQFAKDITDELANRLKKERHNK